MNRRDWERLTPTYQRRLERGGISRSQYESGARLSVARGHHPERTPEHPTRQLPDRAAQYRYVERRRQRETIRTSVLTVVAKDGSIVHLQSASMSRQDRSRVGTFWNAVKEYQQHGDDDMLDALAGRSVAGLDEDGVRRRVELMTSADHLDDIASRNPGLFRRDTIYNTITRLAAVA